MLCANRPSRVHASREELRSKLNAPAGKFSAYLYSPAGLCCVVHRTGSLPRPRIVLGHVLQKLSCGDASRSPWAGLAASKSYRSPRPNDCREPVTRCREIVVRSPLRCDVRIFLPTQSKTGASGDCSLTEQLLRASFQGREYWIGSSPNCWATG